MRWFVSLVSLMSIASGQLMDQCCGGMQIYAIPQCAFLSCPSSYQMQSPCGGGGGGMYGGGMGMMGMGGGMYGGGILGMGSPYGIAGYGNGIGYGGGVGGYGIQGMGCGGSGGSMMQYPTMPMMSQQQVPCQGASCGVPPLPLPLPCEDTSCGEERTKVIVLKYPMPYAVHHKTVVYRDRIRPEPAYLPVPNYPAPVYRTTPAPEPEPLTRPLPVVEPEPPQFVQQPELVYRPSAPVSEPEPVYGPADPVVQQYTAEVRQPEPAYRPYTSAEQDIRQQEPVYRPSIPVSEPEPVYRPSAPVAQFPAPEPSGYSGAVVAPPPPPPPQEGPYPPPPSATIEDSVREYRRAKATAAVKLRDYRGYQGPPAYVPREFLEFRRA